MAFSFRRKYGARYSQCHSKSLKQLNPVIHQIFREQQDRLKKLQEMYKEKDTTADIYN